MPCVCMCNCTNIVTSNISSSAFVNNRILCLTHIIAHHAALCKLPTWVEHPGPVVGVAAGVDIVTGITVTGGQPHQLPSQGGLRAPAPAVQPAQEGVYGGGAGARQGGHGAAGAGVRAPGLHGRHQPRHLRLLEAAEHRRDHLLLILGPATSQHRTQRTLTSPRVEASYLDLV